MGEIFIGIGKFFFWLWERATKKKKAKPPVATESEEQMQQVRLILRRAFVQLKPTRVVLYRLVKMVRPGHALEDAKRSGLLMVATVDELNAAPPAVAYLPVPIDLENLFDYEHLPDSIFGQFWEWPDRAKMSQGSAFCSFMKEHGTMACLCHHIKNQQGSVVGMMAGLYADAQEFTDVHRNAMRQAGMALQRLLPWLKK